MLRSSMTIAIALAAACAHAGEARDDYPNRPVRFIVAQSPGGGGLSNPDWLLRAGDVVECEVEGIGVLRNGVVDEPEI